MTPQKLIDELYEAVENDDMYSRSYLVYAVEDLCAENAKLRELVRKVDHYERLGCYECPHSSSCDVGTLYDDGCAMSREIEREMRELGIEVDA